MSHNDPITRQSLCGPSNGRRQNTLVAPVRFSGRSLFHGYDVAVRLLPAEADTGIVFRRTDLTDVPDIPARCEFIRTVPRRTALASCHEAVVETVEHLMAALAGLHVDNCLVEINAPEVPAFDGSCRDFCDGILEAGLQPLTATVPFIRIDTEVAVADEQHNQSMTLTTHPHPFPAVSYSLDYGPEAPIPSQVFTAEITPMWFYEHVSAARTFVLESEITALKKMGFGLHLTTKDIVVLGADGVIDNELRWSDEGVRHKILDCVGDLALSGTFFHGHVHAHRSGHHLNHELARKLSIMISGDNSVQNQAA